MQGTEACLVVDTSLAVRRSARANVGSRLSMGVYVLSAPASSMTDCLVAMTAAPDDCLGSCVHRIAQLREQTLLVMKVPQLAANN